MEVPEPTGRPESADRPTNKERRMAASADDLAVQEQKRQVIEAVVAKHDQGAHQWPEAGSDDDPQVEREGEHVLSRSPRESGRPRPDDPRRRRAKGSALDRLGRVGAYSKTRGAERRHGPELPVEEGGRADIVKVQQLLVLVA